MNPELHISTRRALTLLASGALMLALATPVAAAAPPPTIYLALGDSLAVGDGASVPSETGYVPLTADYVAGKPHGGAKQLTNLAIGGETTASFLAGQLNGALAAIADPTTDVRVVTLSVGGNDLLDLLNDPGDPCVADPGSETCQSLVAGALHGVASRLPVIIGSINAALAADDGDERILVMTVYNAFGGTGSAFELPVDAALLGADVRIDCAALGTDPRNAGLNDVIACTAMALGATVVDSYAVIGDQALALTHIGDAGFNIHPNDDGYALIAKAHRQSW